MTDYRVYQLTTKGGIENPPNIVVAHDDQQAIEQVKRLVDGHDLEVWDGARFVIGFKSKD